MSGVTNAAAVHPAEVLGGGRVRSGVVRAHLQWVRDYYGTQIAERVLGTLSADARGEVAATTRVSWCSFSTLVFLDRAIETMVGQQRHGFLRELGRYAAHHNLSSYRTYTRDDLQRFLLRTPLLHRQFQDFGSVSYHQLSATAAELTHRSGRCFSRVYCESALGYYEQVIVMHGATPQRVLESTCVCTGDDACKFELSWE